MTWPLFRRRRAHAGDEPAAEPCTAPEPAGPEKRLAEARRWSAWYAAQANVLAPGSGCALACPCCGHPTLVERGGGDRCDECGWYDDGQDDHDSAVVRGGPNGCLSLDAARERYVERGGTPLPRRSRNDPA